MTQRLQQLPDDELDDHGDRRGNDRRDKGLHAQAPPPTCLRQPVKRKAHWPKPEVNVARTVHGSPSPGPAPSTPPGGRRYRSESERPFLVWNIAEGSLRYAPRPAPPDRPQRCLTQPQLRLSNVLMEVGSAWLGARRGDPGWKLGACRAWSARGARYS